ncbi:hypothetical protein HHI36_003323 [Cryptolaemus montrouzieri]|uniref:Ribosome-binding factor A, mitochondrial n=1 Tax=Cryptolaemus montrouzieri TaxID=559131 RepID=A0ABD2PD31_9CUCU
MTSKLAIINFFLRSHHSSSVNYSAIHKTFRKVMGKESGKKRKFRFEDASIPQDTPKLNAFAAEAKTCSRRITMLNKMFMRYITDLMVNGHNWGQYAKFGIEISRVRVSADYKFLHIFWIGKKSVDDDLITNFLTDQAYSLRHELSQLRVMGSVPPIIFYKDKYQSQLTELDQRMAIADFGEDYESSSLNRLKHQLELYSPLEENIKAQLEELNDPEEIEVDHDLPQMPQNVLGLDHSEILNRLQKHIKKLDSKQEGMCTSLVRTTHTGVEETDKVSPRDAFRLFLQKRQMINRKMKKELKSYNPDMEYIKQELKEKSSLDHYDNIENNLHNFDGDFIDEDPDVK